MRNKVKYSKSDIERNISEFGKKQDWNHAMELSPGIWTANPEQNSQGKNLVKWARIKNYLDELDLNRNRILDIG